MEYAVIAVIAIVVGILLLAVRKPDEFRVTRSATFNAPPSAIFDHVNTLEKWQPWSPWVRLDPESTGRQEGPPSGTGAILHWEGRKSGKGSMTITESRPYELIRFRLDFQKPFKATNTAEFTFVPEGPKTRVTWAMYGPIKFMGKIFSVFVNCDKMVGEQFEQGLGNLREIVEKPREAA